MRYMGLLNWDWAKSRISAFVICLLWQHRALRRRTALPWQPPASTAAGQGPPKSDAKTSSRRVRTTGPMFVGLSWTLGKDPPKELSVTLTFSRSGISSIHVCCSAACLTQPVCDFMVMIMGQRHQPGKVPPKPPTEQH